MLHHETAGVKLAPTNTKLTYNDMLDAYSHYPAPIRPYLLRAESHPFLRSILTKSFMRVMIDILSRAPISDPYRPIKLRTDIIANDLDISTKTVTRTLNLLRSRGWLYRSPNHDGRNNWGEFSAGEFILGDELRSMLGLPIISAPHLAHQPFEMEDCVKSQEPETSECETAKHSDFETNLPIISAPNLTHQPSEMEGCDKSNEQETSECEPTKNSDIETKLSDGLYTVNKVFIKEASLENGAFDSKSGNPKKSPKLPANLTVLHTELGIHPFGICKLMQLAKVTGQKLQDVWAAKKDQILNANAREGRAFKYFEFLLKCGEDFSYVARQKALKTPVRTTASAAINHRLYWNKKYCGANGRLVRIHGDGSAEVTDKMRVDAYVMPSDMAPIYEAIAAGKLWLTDE